MTSYTYTCKGDAEGVFRGAELSGETVRLSARNQQALRSSISGFTSRRHLLLARWLRL